MLRALGIDFGTKRIGLALSFASLAEPLIILENDQNVFARLQRIVADEGVQQLVFGISEGEMAVKTRQFAVQLSQLVALPLDYIDETLSSQTVRVKTAIKRSHRNRAAVDHFAAAEILQEWLDTRPKKAYA